MQINQIRQNFLEYFAKNGHTIVNSSSLIPHADPTLYFTNAGMNQFKDVFLGLEKRDYVRAASAQKCVRAGGKHNDLENVGYTARHHTFFEMLGNFSFGDYFKQGAITYAWEFLTKILKIPADKLYVTVYYSDEEAYTIWHKQIGLTPDRIIKIGDKPGGGSDNFWQMGEIGPCGPCTEIFYDHGAAVRGSLPGTPDEDGDRYVEIWNCVFMQFNRDEAGVLHLLPLPSVDTGMGLERIAAVMQQVQSNYAIDLFTYLIKQAAHILQCKDIDHPSLKVVADHIRSITFLISDGVMPANEGRGYVLRRIIRRAVRHGYKLGMLSPFLYKLVKELVLQMGEAYPELILNQEKVEQILLQEEQRFFQTIENGMYLLHEELALTKDKVLAGSIAFKLYDTYGFPLDLTQDICKESNITVDVLGFDQAMAMQKIAAKAAGKFKMEAILNYTGVETKFVGYTNDSIAAKVLALYHNHQSVSSLNSGEEGLIVLDQTVFYAESGGQVGDSGIIQIDGGATAIFTVSDTQKIRAQTFGHLGKLTSGQIKLGDTVTATIDLHRRLSTTRNHSATHLLHKALHEVLGNHAVQKGSLVCSDYTRFDFAQAKALSLTEIATIERIVNHTIMLNYAVSVINMSYADALKSGALALFGEKYTDEVHVVKMGEFSVELCGGTHVFRTGDIGLFRITSESGIASGVRRIEAITGEAAIKYVQDNMAILDGLKEELKAGTNLLIPEKITGLIRENKQLSRELNELKAKLATLSVKGMLDKVEILTNGTKLLVLELANIENKELLELADKFKDKLVSGIVVLGVNNGDKINLVVGVTQDLIQRYKAGVIVSHIATLVGGKGGGRPDLASGGGMKVTQLSATLSGVKTFIETLT